jgi:copper resistance protein C
MRKLVLAFIVSAIAGPAWAHAFLDHSSPAVGATVAAPKEISIWFTEEVEPAFSRIEVTDAAGKRVDEGGTHVDAANAELLHVAVTKLPPGTYKVTWHVVSVDTHHTQGDFTFTVAP